MVRQSRAVVVWVPLAAFAAAGCVKGRVPPEPTSMVAIDQDLSFFVGDFYPCSLPGEAPFTCDVQCPPGQGAGCVPVDNLGPPVEVQLEPFCIDEHEVTNIQYAHCEAVGACPHRPFDNLLDRVPDYGINHDYDDYPANVISYAAAEAYCEFVGKRLPTAFEWERVAGGASQALDLSDKRFYSFLPPGDVDANDCIGLDVPISVCTGETVRITRPVATSADDVVEEDGGLIYDLGGNFREWTSTPYSTSLAGLHITCLPDSRPDCYDAANDTFVHASQCVCDEEPGDCFRVCEGDPADAAVCAPRFEPYAGPIPQDDPAWTPTGLVYDAHIVKGGSYDLSSKAFCQARTTATAFQSDENKTYVSLGFRCAASKGTHPDCP